MLIDNKSIAIVGGGMAGLALARLLQMKNAEVKIYERDFNEAIRVQGSTLDLHEGTGLEALKRAGLLEEFYKHHRAIASKMLLVDKSLHIHFDDHDFAEITSETRPEIDRAPLRNLLLSSLRPNTVVWDSNFSSMEKQNNGWLLHFKNGTSAYADLVIAADGANSKLRPYLSDTKAIYSGITLIQGDIYDASRNTPKLLAFSKGGKVMAFDNEQFMAYGNKGDGSIMFIAAFKCPENWLTQTNINFHSKEEVVNWFNIEFAAWSDEWKELFTCEDVHFTPRPQYYFPLDQHWATQENLTMIGDAVHRMPPFAGEGANVAMQDSFELAEVLTNGKYSDTKSAIAFFEKDMVVRGAKATKDTLENTERMFAANGLEQMMAFFNDVKK